MSVGCMFSLSLLRQSMLYQVRSHFKQMIAVGVGVFISVIAGVSAAIVHVLSDRPPAVMDVSDQGAETVGSLYDAQEQPKDRLWTDTHKGLGRRHTLEPALTNARDVSGVSIKSGSTGTAAVAQSTVLPSMQRHDRRPTEISKTQAADVVRAAQRELRRRGCYAGRIDGDWGPTLRFAAAMFFDGSRTDVSLAKVDDVLLALSRQPAARGCREAVGSLSSQRPSPQVQYVTLEVDGVVVGGTANKRETRHAPRIVGSNGTNIEPGFVGGRWSVGDENGEKAQKKLSVEANTQRRTKRSNAVSVSQKGRRKMWKRRVYQGINLSGN